MTNSLLEVLDTPDEVVSLERAVLPALPSFTVPLLPPPVPVLSFFTGAGFLDLGFQKGGFEVIWRNEYDLSFVKGYEYGQDAMFGSKGHRVENTQSIVDLGPNQIAREAFGSLGRPDVFGMIGGPPCPDFSVGGKNRGGEGERGRLSAVYINRILELQPTFFLFENVPGLLRTSKHREFLTDLMKQLSRDYVVDINILRALDYGVPQDRERVFMVGFQRKWLKRNVDLDLSGLRDWFLWAPLIDGSSQATLLGKKKWFPWNTGRHYHDAKNQFAWPDTSPYGEEPLYPGVPHELTMSSLFDAEDYLASLPNGQEAFVAYSDKFLRIAEGDVSRKSFKRLHRWRYSPAVAYGNNEVHLHPWQPRRLTVREALRIQSVPDEWALPPGMPLSHKFKTIGNGVPVKLGEAVARAFQEVLAGRVTSP